MKRSRIIFLLIAVVWAGFYLAGSYKGKLQLEAAELYVPSKPIQPFTLESTATALVNTASLKGQWTFLFTGYTYCPDICPTTMAALKSHWSELTAVTDFPVKVWMISVDPQRDSLAQLGPYVGFFGDDFIGVRGEHDALQPFVSDLGMMYSIPEGEQQNYEVAHSAAIVLINPAGRQQAIFQPVSRTAGYSTIHPKLMVRDFKAIVQAAQSDF